MKRYFLLINVCMLFMVFSIAPAIAAMIAVTIASTIAQVYFQQQASRKQEAIAEANQAAQIQEASAIKRQNQTEADRFKLRAQEELATQKSEMAKTGVSLLSPSFREVRAGSERAIDLDTEIIKQSGMAAFSRARSRAKIFGMEAESIRSTRSAQAGVTLLGGANRAVRAANA